MKRLFFIAAGTAIMALLATSCLSTHKFSIEVMEPATKVIPAPMSTVALISRNFKYIGDTLQNYYKKNVFLTKDHRNKITNIDSLATTSCLSGLARHLKENNVPVKSKIIDYRTFEIEYGEKLKPIPWAVIEDICRRNKADGVISLETYTYINTVTSGYYSRVPAPVTGVTSGAAWTLYDPSRHVIVDTYTDTNTLVWDNNIHNGKFKMPGRIKAIHDASIANGEKYADRLSPHWVKTNRFYYIPSANRFKAATAFAEKGDWKNAGAQWQKIAFEKPNSRLAFFALYNLAVATEMNGEIDQALSWADKSLSCSLSLSNSDFTRQSSAYIKILKKRTKSILKIKTQEESMNP